MYSKLVFFQAIRKGAAADLPVHFGARPVCKDYLKGECHRASCKFRHVPHSQFDMELTQNLGEIFDRENKQQQVNKSLLRFTTARAHITELKVFLHIPRSPVIH